MTTVRVFVCGSPDRGDDAVAIRAIQGLDEAIRALADIEVCGTVGVEDLVDVPQGTPCLVLDAAVGVAPGSIVRGTLASLAQRARSAGPAPHSSHILPIHETMALAEAIRGSLPEGSFIGIGSTGFDFGAPLSQAVEAGLPDFRSAISAEIERLARGAHGGHTTDSDPVGEMDGDRLATRTESAGAARSAPGPDRVSGPDA